MIVLDFETRSTCDIRHGVTRYTKHPTTQVLCLCWVYDDDEPEVHLWHRGHPWIEQSRRPDELLARIASGEECEAHNAGFEFGTWNDVFMREFPEIDVHLKLEQLHCSAAKGSCVSMPRALGDAANASGIVNRKDERGVFLIEQLSKPMKKKKGITGIQFNEDETLHRENWAYCSQDVLTEREYSAWLPPMMPREREYWLMDQRMNMRGILLDQAAARDGRDLSLREADRLNFELDLITNGGVDRAARRAVFKDWINQELTALEADNLPDTRADTISFALYGAPTKAGDIVRETMRPLMEKKWEQYGERGEPLRRALEISLEVNRTSVGKYERMLECVEPSDGRLHDIMLYNGADRTGRWSGKGVQPHNFVRGYKEEMPEVWEDIKTLDLEFVTLIWGDPLPALAKACRGALTASPGKLIYAADFNAIEARKLAWLSNCTSQLALFRSKGGDPYIDMAQAIYERPLNKKDHPLERNLGKKAVLGLGYCFSADTLVLTKRGWSRIDQVIISDMLWDGCEWVSHRGLVCNGEKFVMSLGDTFLTMDHPILCDNSFHLAEKVGESESLHSQALATGAGALPLSDMSSALVTASNTSWSNVNVGNPSTGLIWQIGARVAQLAAKLARNVRQRIEGTKRSKTQCPIRFIEKDFSIASPQQSLDATILRRDTSKIMEHEASKSVMNGTGTAPHFCGMFRPFLGGMIRTLKSTELIMTAIMSRAIFASRQGRSNASTRVGKKEKVYDLIDAGPRHRFTILTKDGPMIVHNSMGWEKFQMTVFMEEGIWLEDEFCQKIVKIYRKEKCPEVPLLWKAANDSAIAAVLRGGEHWFGGDEAGCGAISYFVRGPFLHCRLPSGRLLAYLRPEVHTRVTWRFSAINERGKPCQVPVSSRLGISTQRARREAERLAEKARKTLTNEPPESFQSPHLSFMGRDTFTRKWRRCGTHGGTLVENFDQASSRDLLAESMLRVDQDDRFDLLLSIHDEVIAEGLIGCATLQEFEDQMAEVPAWAPGMPIKAEGWIGERLRK